MNRLSGFSINQTPTPTRSPSQPDHILKILVVGDSGVGKSSLSARFCDRIYSDRYSLTIGVGFHVKTLNIFSLTIRLQIWDTAGQERFRGAITSNYYRQCHGVVLAYDVNDDASFNNLEYHYQQVVEKAPKEAKIILVGTKAEKENKENRRVDSKTARKLAESYGMHFWETSAKEGTNVDESFIDLVQMILTDNFGRSSTLPSSHNATTTSIISESLSSRHSFIKIDENPKYVSFGGSDSPDCKPYHGSHEKITYDGRVRTVILNPGVVLTESEQSKCGC